MTANLEQAFKQAIRDLNALPTDVDLPEKTKLRLYGLYASVVKGPNLPAVSSDELMRNKTEALKRKAWKDALKLSKTQAMEEYCEVVKELRRETRRPITFSGDLFRKDSQLGWTRCYIELKERVIYYYDHRKNDSVGAQQEATKSYPSGVLFLMDGCVVSSASDGVQRVLLSPDAKSLNAGSKSSNEETLFVFTIAHPKAHKVFTLGAPTKDEAQQWMDAIRLESTKRHLVGSSTSLSGFIHGDGAPAEMYTDSFESKYLLPPVRSSQDFGVPAAFSFAVDECVANFLNLCSDASLWNFSHERINVRTFVQKGEALPGLKEEDSKSVVGVLGHAVQINAPSRCVFDLVWSMGARRNVDPQLESWSVVEELGPQTRVDHVVYSAVWPTSRRDFCRLSHYRVDERNGAILVVGVSVDHLMCPSLRDSVRAKLFCTGFLIVPTSEGTCQVKYLIVVDPVISSIPRRFILTVALSQTTILEKMQSYFSEHEYLVMGAMLKGPVKNIALLTTPELVHRRKKRSTASLTNSMIGAQFVKNNAFSEVPLPSLKETVVKVIVDEQQERWWLKVWFIAVICVVVTHSLDSNMLNLLALILASWGVVLNPSRRAYITGQLLIPSSMDKVYLALMLQKILNECPSMNGSFSFFGRWQPALSSRVALMTDVKSGNAVLYTEVLSNNRQGVAEGEKGSESYTALFVAQAMVSDHSRWTSAPVLVSCFGDRVLVSVDRRCAQDFNKFFDMAMAMMSGEDASKRNKDAASVAAVEFSSPGMFPRSNDGVPGSGSESARSRRLSSGPLLFRHDSARSIM